MALVLAGVGLLADFSFFDLLYAGAGPALMGGAIADTSGGGSASAGAYFALATRAGLALGSSGPNERKAFTIGLDMHVIFTSEVVVTPLIALGYESY